MALVKGNALTKGWTGKFGDILYKQIGTKTFAYPIPRQPKKQSQKQRSTRDRFREATEYAHMMMLDEKKKAYYKQLARKLKVPNAYTAAITDYMRKPVISSVDARQYTGKPGGEILIVAEKKQIKLESVNVIISSEDHEIIEHGAAQHNSTRGWYYQSKLASPSAYTSYVIRITATDAFEQSVDATVSGSVLAPINEIVYP